LVRDIHLAGRANPKGRAPGLFAPRALIKAAMAFDDENTVFRVVRNAEDTHSIWPLGRPVPAGWDEAGFTGTKAACLDHIDRVWTDMRPLSLRRALAAQAGEQSGTGADR
jgi:MbtH protein